MKKLIFTALSLLAISSAFAQTKVDNTNTNEPKLRIHNPSDFRTERSNSTFGKAEISDWYSPLDWASRAGAANFLDSKITFLFGDSIPKYIDEGDTIRRFNKISVGIIVDPKDDNIELTDNTALKMSKYTGYTMDSIIFRYFYVRHVAMKDDGQGNQVPVRDTLIINYYTLTNGGIIKTTQDGEKYGNISWNTATHSSRNFIGTQKVVLSEDDSTSVFNVENGFENSFGISTMALAVDMPGGVVVPRNPSVDNLVAYTMTFKPGHAYDSNSVMVYRKDPAQFPLANARVNFFGYGYSSNDGTPEQQVAQPTFTNSSVFGDKFNAYYPGGQINNGWVGYVPGNAYFKIQYLESDVHLVSNNVGLKDIKNDNFAMTNVYPNPANVNGTAIMGFSLKNASTVSVSIFNIAGQLEKTVINSNFAAGEHAEEFALTGLKAGIYIVNMTVNGVSSVKKLTIAE